MKSLLLALSFLLIQQPQSQETGVIQGFVTRIGTGDPVARAKVTLTTDGRPAVSMSATTDGGGKFVITNVQPGRYRLFATRDGYVRAEYGQSGPSLPGTPLNVAAKQELKDVRLQVTPTG